MECSLSPHARPSADFRVSVRGAGRRSEIRLDGRLPIDWAVRLTTRLAELETSILDGFAERDAGGAWTVDLRCAAEGPMPDSEVIRAALLDAVHVASPRWPTLLSYELSPPTTPGPARLRVVARDAVGFLAHVLCSMALHGIFPRTIEIATRDGIVDDVFALSSIGQGDLSPGARAHLERALEGACPRTSRPPGFSVLGAAGAPAAPTRSVPARRS